MCQRYRGGSVSTYLGRYNPEPARITCSEKAFHISPEDVVSHDYEHFEAKAEFIVLVFRYRQIVNRVCAVEGQTW